MEEIVMSKIDKERLFGPGVDFFKSYHACLSILNILKTQHSSRTLQRVGISKKMHS